MTGIKNNLLKCRPRVKRRLWTRGKMQTRCKMQSENKMQTADQGSNVHGSLQLYQVLYINVLFPLSSADRKQDSSSQLQWNSTLQLAWLSLRLAWISPRLTNMMLWLSCLWLPLGDWNGTCSMSWLKISQPAFYPQSAFYTRSAVHRLHFTIFWKPSMIVIATYPS